VIKAIEIGNWSTPKVQEYTKIKQELAIHKGTILRGNRLVIPPTLGNKAVDLASTHRASRHRENKKTSKGESLVCRHRQAYRREDKKLSPLPSINARKRKKLSEPLKMTPLWSLERGFNRFCSTLSLW
jgi:hypothetical protein